MSADCEAKSPVYCFGYSPYAASVGVRPGESKRTSRQGQYIFAVAGGCACHSEPKGVYNAGGRAFPIPFGTVYSTNITPDKETGLGSWTDQQIIRRNGQRLPARRQSTAYRSCPTSLYSGMAQEDLKALMAYLRSLKPVKKANAGAEDLGALRAQRRALRSVAQSLRSLLRITRPGPEKRRRARTLSRRLMCHRAATATRRETRSAYPTYRSTWPARPKTVRSVSGVPTSRPDKETGIGDWKREDIAELLLTGT